MILRFDSDCCSTKVIFRVSVERVQRKKQEAMESASSRTVSIDTGGAWRSRGMEQSARHPYGHKYVYLGGRRTIAHLHSNFMYMYALT